MDKKELYNQLLEQKGAPNQLAVAIEEMSELTKEITKIMRIDSNENIMHLAEEIGDVEICLEQLTQRYDIHDKIKFFKAFKLKRLEQFYLDKGENNE